MDVVPLFLGEGVSAISYNENQLCDDKKRYASNYSQAKREFSEMENLHLLLLALLFEVSGVLSGSHFLLLDVMMMFSFRLKHSMSSLINNKLN